MHHVLFPRKHWESSKHAEILRLGSGLIVPMYYYQHHNVLHNDCPPVVLPTDDMLGIVCREMRSSDDIIEQINNLLVAMDKSIKRVRRFTEYKRRTMELSIEAIEAQLPHIQASMPRQYRPKSREIIDLGAA
jgi:hypothetical protein